MFVPFSHPPASSHLEDEESQPRGFEAEIFQYFKCKTNPITFEQYAMIPFYCRRICDAIKEIKYENLHSADYDLSVADCSLKSKARDSSTENEN